MSLYSGGMSALIAFNLVSGSSTSSTTNSLSGSVGGVVGVMMLFGGLLSTVELVDGIALLVVCAAPSVPLMFVILFLGVASALLMSAVCFLFTCLKIEYTLVGQVLLLLGEERQRMLVSSISLSTSADAVLGVVLMYFSNKNRYLSTASHLTSLSHDGHGFFLRRRL